MLRVLVTNESASDATWHVEPYGDEVRLTPKDHLAMVFEHPTELAVELTLHHDGTVAWSSVDNEVLAPTAVELNGQSIWPAPGPATG